MSSLGICPLRYQSHSPTSSLHLFRDEESDAEDDEDEVEEIVD